MSGGTTNYLTPVYTSLGPTPSACQFPTPGGPFGVSVRATVTTETAPCTQKNDRMPVGLIKINIVSPVIYIILDGTNDSRRREN